MQTTRQTVRPGDPFVDAGGVEECFPTVRGDPDHGDAWSRSWSLGAGHVGDAWVDIPGLRLRRRLSDGCRSVQADYEIQGEPGTRFVHAVHALLAVGPGARLLLRTGLRTQLLDVPAPGSLTEAAWPPVVAGRTIDELGPSDGTATAALVTDCPWAVVVDGTSALELAWSASAPAATPVSLLLWRNLGGWPAGAPYRSIGVEPMVGRTAMLRAARGSPPSVDAACTGPDGRASWQLSLRAWTRVAPRRPTRRG